MSFLQIFLKKMTEMKIKKWKLASFIGKIDR